MTFLAMLIAKEVSYSRQPAQTEEEPETPPAGQVASNEDPQKQSLHPKFVWTVSVSPGLDRFLTTLEVIPESHFFVEMSGSHTTTRLIVLRSSLITPTVHSSDSSRRFHASIFLLGKNAQKLSAFLVLKKII
jgi:hypothetical protein